LCSDSHRSQDPTARVAVKSGLSSIRYAIRHHSLLEKHTSILVGISGGIDSLVLLFLLHKYKDIYRQMWEIKACHIDKGFPAHRSADLEEYLSARGIALTVVKTGIYTRTRRSDDKCFFCSRARRQKLMEYAEDFNINNIALAHHQEDVAETLLLNMLYAGRTSTLLPIQPIAHGRFNFVRPLYYLDKTTILDIARAFDLKSQANSCPYYKESRRELIREKLNDIKERNPDVYTNVFHSIFNIKKTYMPS
jgi:tRNA 2-thiocytidine biosynthesis protein TtcA